MICAVPEPERPRAALLARARRAIDEGNDDRANTLARLALADAADELTGWVRHLVEGLDSIERELAQVGEALGQLGGRAERINAGLAVTADQLPEQPRQS
jgi:hypothetical protein